MVIPAGSGPVEVDTTAVTANSPIIVKVDASVLSASFRPGTGHSNSAILLGPGRVGTGSPQQEPMTTRDAGENPYSKTSSQHFTSLVE